ncbi:MAG TPA: hypothetical protein EYH44_01000 [Thermoprotei archaeon]|nr:hypothetical protein [Thermoprotei archaeon]
MKIIERLELGEYATFKPNKELPRHRWFYFKEGFSRDLVHYLLKKYDVDSGDWVLDPFMGVGTTPLTCREYGVNTVGIEISPLFKLIAEAKIMDYDIEDIKKYFNYLLSYRKRIDLNGIHGLLKKAFPKPSLIDILRIREAIENIYEGRYRNLFYLALLSAANKSTYMIKDGSKLRFSKRNIPPFIDVFRRTVNMIIRDIIEMELKNVYYYLYQGDARQMTMVEDESIDLVITSPPYLNKIEYTTVYEIEYLILYGDTRVNPLRSYIGLTFSRRDFIELPKIIDKDLPPAAHAYFNDMYKVLNEIYRVLRGGGKAILVVGQGIFPDRIIPSDEILAKLGREIGFRRPEIWVINRRIAVRNRTIKIGVANESIVILSK